MLHGSHYLIELLITNGGHSCHSDIFLVLFLPYEKPLAVWFMDDMCAALIDLELFFGTKFMKVLRSIFYSCWYFILNQTNIWLL